MLSPNYGRVPVEVGSLTVLKPHRLFGLRSGAQIFYAEQRQYIRGEVVAVEVVATGEIAICANFSTQDSDLIMLLVPVYEADVEHYKWCVGTHSELKILGSVQECQNLTVGMFNSLPYLAMLLTSGAAASLPLQLFK